MIRFERATVAYEGARTPALRDVNLEVAEGELCLVVGRTGSGKSTLLRAVNGLVPWFTGGRLDGRVTVGGRSTAEHPPRELADTVGMVSQVPADDFVAEIVEDELAYTMENLGVAAPAMRRRVEEIIDLLGLQTVRSRALRTLSLGEQQRVAIGSVLAAAPRVLLLDEPTSALDPGAAEDVLAAITRLVHDLGLTVLMAEHRLERVVEYVDSVVILEDGAATAGLPAEMMEDAPVAPPVVELGRMAGWRPLPLSVRDARRQAGSLRDRLPSAPTPPPPTFGARNASPGEFGGPKLRDGTTALAAVERVHVRYGAVAALGGVSLEVGPGETVAVMGRNGAGKSTLLGLLAGLRSPDRGSARVGGDDPTTLSPRELVARVALVPPDPGLLLYTGSVGEECALADREGDLPDGATAASTAGIVPGLDSDAHPRDLSEGQRLALVLGVVLAPGPRVVLLDEPTRGLDYAAKARLARTLRALTDAGHAVVLATHDVELVADVASRVVVLAEGEVVVDGPAREVLASSPMFAPQVAKVLAPEPWLTVQEVEGALAGAVAE